VCVCFVHEFVLVAYPCQICVHFLNWWQLSAQHHLYKQKDAASVHFNQAHRCQDRRSAGNPTTDLGGICRVLARLFFPLVDGLLDGSLWQARTRRATQRWHGSLVILCPHSPWTNQFSHQHLLRRKKKECSYALSRIVRHQPQQTCERPYALSEHNGAAWACAESGCSTSTRSMSTQLAQTLRVHRCERITHWTRVMQMPSVNIH
jgi:hypothetical protein